MRALDIHADVVVFLVEEDPGEADYLYDLKRLMSFSGNRLRKKHNQLRQFGREFEGRFTVSPLTEAGLGPVLALARKLNDFQEPSDGIDEENLALNRLEAEFGDPDLELRGIVLTIDGAVAGFSIYSPLGEGVADIHFEKASRDFRNAGTAVTCALVRTLVQQGFTMMNREQDLNDAGLRQAKRSWEPVALHRRGNLILQQAPQ